MGWRPIPPPVPPLSYPAEWLLDIFGGGRTCVKYIPYLPPYKTDESYRKILPRVQFAGYAVVIIGLIVVGLLLCNIRSS